MAPLLLAAAVGLAACGGRSIGPVGYSPPRPGEHAARSADGGAGAVRSPVPADFRVSFAKLGDRFLSAGHGRRYQAVLWLNDVARGAWAALPRPMPDGALVVEEAIDEDRTGERPAGLWVMERARGAWRFVAVGPDGDVAAGERVAACVACHDGAPHDDLFVEVTREAR